MALGVVESEQIRERHTSLKKGEYFILYTDGITEALTPTLDLYGEQRLFEVIEKSIFNSELPNKDLSALELLEEIQNSVENFLGSGFVTDDLTLMVIKRQ
jgi:phosphoserine phosphatase RsbU/P